MADWPRICDELSQQFSPWLPWKGLSGHLFMQHPGVYLFAELRDHAVLPSVADPQILYIGETTAQTLLARFVQFEEAARTGCTNRHLGGEKYSRRSKGELVAPKCRLLPDDFFIAVFPVKLDEPESSAFIRYVERMALWCFVKANGRYPPCNSI